jgi:AcrR family transcriptional regulator
MPFVSRCHSAYDGLVGLRQRKKERTRDRLVGEALRLFARNGYEETSVDEIAEAADVSPRTFFRYFPTKADVVFADLPARLGAVETALEHASARAIHALVRDVLIESIDLLGDDPELLAVRAKLVLENPPLRMRILEFFATVEATIGEAYARALGVPASSLAPRLAAVITLGSGRSAMLSWSADQSGDLESTIRHSFALTAPTVRRILRGD